LRKSGEEALENRRNPGGFAPIPHATKTRAPYRGSNGGVGGLRACGDVSRNPPEPFWDS
jgi:hypothetical protein